VERILAATARPKGLLETMADEARQRLNQLHPDPPVPPRPTAEYQSLLEEPRDEKPPPADKDQADEGPSNQDESSERDSGDERLA
jgi:hypothetical protein